MHKFYRKHFLRDLQTLSDNVYIIAAGVVQSAKAETGFVSFFSSCDRLVLRLQLTTRPQLWNAS